MMADLQYNFLGDNFTVYKPIETPKVQLDLPLFDSPLDISSWASGISSSGTPIVKSNIEGPKMIVDNNEEIQSSPQISFSQISQNITGNKKKAVEFFMSKGLSQHAAAGIVGNLIQESNLNTTIKGDGGKAFGMAQWHPDRQKGLKSLAQKMGTDISDVNTQLEYIWQELNTTHKSALDGLLRSKNVEEATVAFMKHFEKPGKPELQKRINYSRSLLS